MGEVSYELERAGFKKLLWVSTNLRSFYFLREGLDSNMAATKKAKSGTSSGEDRSRGLLFLSWSVLS